MIYNVNVGNTTYRLTLEREGDGWKCELDGRPIYVSAELIGPDVISMLTNGKIYQIKRDRIGDQIRLWVANIPYTAELTDPRSLSPRLRNREKSDTSRLLASMPGKVLRVLVREMQQVDVGQSLLVVEAMKMQNEIKSPNKGIVKRLVSEGAYVNAGDVLAIVE